MAMAATSTLVHPLMFADDEDIDLGDEVSVLLFGRNLLTNGF